MWLLLFWGGLFVVVCFFVSFFFVYAVDILSQPVLATLVSRFHITTLDKYIPNVCRSAYYMETRRISSIRQHHAVEATKILVSAFLLAKLDYGHSLLLPTLPSE